MLNTPGNLRNMTKSNYLLKVHYWNRRRSILILMALVFNQGVASSFKCLEGATDQLLLPTPCKTHIIKTNNLSWLSRII